MLTPDTLPTVVFHRTRLAVPSPISCPLIADSAMTIARSAREDRAWKSEVVVLSRETKRVFRSLVLQSSARDPGFHCSLPFARIALGGVRACRPLSRTEHG